MVIHVCERCEKQFNKKSLFLWHTEGRKNQCKETNKIIEQKINIIEPVLNIIEQELNIIEEVDKKKEIKCNDCDKTFVKRYGLNRHIKKCKIRNNILKQLKIENEKLKEDNTKINLINNEDNVIEYALNNRLINIITDKNKTIEKLKDKVNVFEKNDDVIINKKQNELILNNMIIVSRITDNYIDAIKLCQAGNKNFNDWISLESTKELINILENDTGIPASKLVDVDNENNSAWIHPNMVIELAHWISVYFLLQVSRWIKTLFMIGYVSIEVLHDKERQIKIKDQKIQLLEDLYVKKQKRTEYPKKNVIYVLTTEDNKKKRIYIIGKSKLLKKRLSTYNKTSEHEVIYYRGCKTENDMNIAEQMVLTKLQEHKEKANRDRFILPIEYDIKYFIDIIDTSINFFT